MGCVSQIDKALGLVTRIKTAVDKSESDTHSRIVSTSQTVGELTTFESRRRTQSPTRSEDRDEHLPTGLNPMAREFVSINWRERTDNVLNVPATGNVEEYSGSVSENRLDPTNEKSRSSFRVLPSFIDKLYGRLDTSVAGISSNGIEESTTYTFVFDARDSGSQYSNIGFDLSKTDFVPGIVAAEHERTNTRFDQEAAEFSLYKVRRPIVSAGFALYVKKSLARVFERAEMLIPYPALPGFMERFYRFLDAAIVLMPRNDPNRPENTATERLPVVVLPDCCSSNIKYTLTNMLRESRKLDKHPAKPYLMESVYTFMDALSLLLPMESVNQSCPDLTMLQSLPKARKRSRTFDEHTGDIHKYR